jgi:hypothetical protein
MRHEPNKHKTIDYRHAVEFSKIRPPRPPAPWLNYTTLPT